MSTQIESRDDIEVADELITSESTELAVLSTIDSDQFTVALITLQGLASQQFDLSTREGLAEARRVRDLCTRARKRADEIYTEWNAPRLKAAKDARDMRDFFQAAVQTFETPLHEAITADARRKKEEKERRDRDEAARIAGHRAALAALSAIPEAFAFESSEAIQSKLRELQAPGYLAFREWDEYGTSDIGGQSPAESTLASVINTLKVSLENAVMREKLAALEAEQARRDQEARDAEAARQAEAKRAEEARQAEADRVAAEERAAEAARQAEARRVQGLRDRIMAIQTVPGSMIGMPSHAIQAELDVVRAVDIAEFAELAPDAAVARDRAIEALTELYTSADAKEKQDAELAQLRAEKHKSDQRERAEQARREQEARDAEAARLAEAKRVEAARLAEAERIAAEARSAEDARQAAANAARARAEKNATRLLEKLREVVAYAREFGHDWLCLYEADGLIAEIDLAATPANAAEEVAA